MCLCFNKPGCPSGMLCMFHYTTMDYACFLLNVLPNILGHFFQMWTQFLFCNILHLCILSPLFPVQLACTALRGEKQKALAPGGMQPLAQDVAVKGPLALGAQSMSRAGSSWGPFPWRVDGCLLPVCSHCRPAVCILISSYRDTGPIGSGTTHRWPRLTQSLSGLWGTGAYIFNQWMRGIDSAPNKLYRFLCDANASSNNSNLISLF